MKRSVKFLLFFYEFLATGFWEGVISESLLRRDHGGIMRNFFRHAKPWVLRWRDPRRPNVYQDIESLCRRWEKEKLPLWQRTIEWFLLRPLPVEVTSDSGS
jgi:hypothetical protein